VRRRFLNADFQIGLGSHFDRKIGQVSMA